jgi:biotin synthase
MSNESEKQKIIRQLGLETPEEVENLYRRAYETKLRHIGPVVHFRGLIEFSNICRKNCHYCGIRRGNARVKRFLMGGDEILEAARWAYESHYGSVVLQAGERQDEPYIAFVEETVRSIKALSDNRLGITLSLGEQSEETYRRWFDAGAHRYLLRIETSSEKLYRSLHPEDHRFSTRLECLNSLRRAGFQVGTGVMIGLPGQTLEDLADDILFFQRLDVDMIGMGPFIPHHDTPMAESLGDFKAMKAGQLELGLKMIAATRLALRDVNIAAATALQALRPNGRELGLQAGANIIMPVITETKYRSAYQLYDGKPCLDENASQCRSCLQRRIESIGETIGFDQWGDSPHFRNRQTVS